MALTTNIEDPDAPDIISLLKTHLEFAAVVTPAGSGHALDLQKLRQPDITFWTARDEAGALLGCVALKSLSADHGEIKSMHTLEAARGKGVGTALMEVLIRAARERGYTRLSIETGDHEAFKPSHQLYEKMGFSRCPPFGAYEDDPFSICMAKAL